MQCNQVRSPILKFCRSDYLARSLLQVIELPNWFTTIEEIATDTKHEYYANDKRCLR